MGNPSDPPPRFSHHKGNGDGGGGGGVPAPGIAGLGNGKPEVAQRRCPEIVSNPSFYDRDLVSLCRMTLQASR